MNMLIVHASVQKENQCQQLQEVDTMVVEVLIYLQGRRKTDETKRIYKKKRKEMTNRNRTTLQHNAEILSVLLA